MARTGGDPMTAVTEPGAETTTAPAPVEPVAVSI
jgi:hypothetical protein